MRRLSNSLVRSCPWLVVSAIVLYAILWCTQFALVLNTIRSRFDGGYKIEFFNWIVKTNLEKLKLSFSLFQITFILPELEISENGVVLETIDRANFNYSIMNNPFLEEVDITIDHVGNESYLAANGKEHLFCLHGRSPELRVKLNKEGIVTTLTLQYYGSKVVDKAGDLISMKSTSIKLDRTNHDNDAIAYDVSLQWREEPSHKWYTNCKNCNPMHDLGSTEIKVEGDILINRGNMSIARVDNTFFKTEALLTGQYFGSLNIKKATITNDLFVIRFKDVQLVALNTSNADKNAITTFEEFVERIEFLCNARIDIESYKQFLDFLFNFIMSSGIVHYQESVDISRGIKTAILRLQEQDNEPRDNALSLHLSRPSLQESMQINGIPVIDLLN